MLKKIIELNIKKGTDKDKRLLSALSDHKDMGPKVPIVYIFSLGQYEEKINYPKEPGSVVYIGETMRDHGSGLRFKSHISKSLTEGLSTQINHTLSVYYHLDRELNLKVFEVTNEESTKAVEKKLLQSHWHRFGANPIGQGGTGKTNCPKEIQRFFLENENTYNECCEIFIQKP